MHQVVYKTASQGHYLTGMCGHDYCAVSQKNFKRTKSFIQTSIFHKRLLISFRYQFNENKMESNFSQSEAAWDKNCLAVKFSCRSPLKAMNDRYVPVNTYMIFLCSVNHKGHITRRDTVYCHHKSVSNILIHCVGRHSTLFFYAQSTLGEIVCFIA